MHSCHWASGDLDLLQRDRQPHRPVELINFFKLFLLVVHQQCQQYAEAHHLAVEVPLFDDRVGRHGVKDRMGQATVVVRREILGEEDGGNAGGHHDGQHHLFHIVAAQALSCGPPVPGGRMPAAGPGTWC